ncbi:Wzz/FepE/Etk N-terminal domain-containing protein [Flavobacterium sp.]|uniref:Wzz/FepE/Etk N-terminal domain-containing protein n=1 Tax=Flavobacterium sp. TaxID=239 RepID=UPI001B7080FE|nr:Wzz/FepE/Etk N-terminal domain-containing protein [Flavobacterium sp.]MBP6128082.1 lipopolysaccharide biosynthesis protein [Flavobacterium sp.]
METPNDEITLKELLLKTKEWYTYLLSQWKMIVLAGIVGALVGLGYSFYKKPVYTATLTYALEDGKAAGGGLGSLASSFGFDIGGAGGNSGAFSGANLMELFKSRAMVEQTLLAPVIQNNKTISLAEMYIQDKKWRGNWEEKPALKNITFLPNSDRTKFTRAQDSIFGVIYNDLSKNALTVDQKDKKVAIGTITMKGTNEYFAQQFNLALTKTVTDFYIETKSKRAKENMDILVRQTDSIRRELNGAITGVAVANDNTFGLNPALNVKRVPSARRQVDVQANTAILTEIVKQTELAKVTLRKETPLIQVIDQPILPLPKEKFGKAKGIVLGGILAGFLTILGLIIRRIFKELSL